MTAARPATILLVEDASGDVKLIKMVLKDHGFRHELVVVHDGAAALEYLTGTGAHAGRDAARRPALVLMDINMPRLNGFETLEKVRGIPALADLPVAFLTSSNDPKDAQRAFRLGAKGFLSKPWPGEDAAFVSQLEAILSELLT